MKDTGDFITGGVIQTGGVVDEQESGYGVSDFKNAILLLSWIRLLSV
jgi:hypothetical protein